MERQTLPHPDSTPPTTDRELRRWSLFSGGGGATPVRRTFAPSMRKPNRRSAQRQAFT